VRCDADTAIAATECRGKQQQCCVVRLCYEALCWCDSFKLDCSLVAPAVGHPKQEWLKLPLTACKCWPTGPLHEAEAELHNSIRGQQSQWFITSISLTSSGIECRTNGCMPCVGASPGGGGLIPFALLVKWCCGNRSFSPTT
jgi:hypothetical protein